MIDKRLIVADAVRDPSGIRGNALLIEAGKVTAIGDRAELGRDGITEERYPGATIVPGLRDAHFHPVAYTAAISGISLKAAADLDEVKALLRSRAPQAPGSPVVAIRLDDESVAERRLPTREDLDDAVSDRPALVHRYCGHIAVANSAALRAAGVDASIPDPPGGIIDRDAEGVPTGVLRETAIDLVSASLSDAVSVTPQQLNRALRGLAGLGITSIGAMTRTGEGPWATLGNEVEIVTSAAGELPIRSHAYVIAGSQDELAWSAELMATPGSKLSWAGVKRFGDGSLGGHTAAMHDPFADRPEETGTLRLDDLDAELAAAAIALGGGVAIHAIGDLACGRVIDLFERLIQDGADPGLLRLEHASVLAIGDIGRLARLGVVASVQPAFMASETGWLEKRVGPERLARTYPLRSLEAAGVRMAGGSDCPVEPPNPWWGMAAARDRAGIEPQSESLSAESAFRLFTSGAAAALREPPPLAPGSPADFLAVDRDPVTATPDELRATEVIETWLDGLRVEVDRGARTWAE